MKAEILKALRQRASYISGQELCNQLDVSRTAIWKTIKQLKEEGYQIEAVQNKGYRIVAEPDNLSAHMLASTCKTSWAGKKVYYFEQLDSTNIMAKKLAEEEAEHGSIVVAEVQTLGRGRRGREWSSPKSCGIWATIILKADILPEKAPMLTIVKAMAVMKAISRITGLKPLIKWPNDILLENKKVCGILTEMSAQIDYINYVVIGVGINVHNKEFQGELATKATSIGIELAKMNHCQTIKRAELLAAVLEDFERYYDLFMQTGDVSLMQSEYNDNLINYNALVRVLDPLAPFEGKALGINAYGELLVEQESGIVPVRSGEVSIMGALGYV